MRVEVVKQGGRTLFGARIRSVRDIFSAMESHGDGDGLVSFAEFADGLERLNIKATRAQFLSAFQFVDDDFSGVIDWAEFNDMLGDGTGEITAQKKEEREEKKKSEKVAPLMSSAVLRLRLELG